MSLPLPLDLICYLTFSSLEWNALLQKSGGLSCTMLCYYPCGFRQVNLSGLYMICCKTRGMHKMIPVLLSSSNILWLSDIQVIPSLVHKITAHFFVLGGKVPESLTFFGWAHSHAYYHHKEKFHRLSKKVTHQVHVSELSNKDSH